MGIRVAVCRPCGREMLETELFDHIEEKNHAEIFRNLSVAEYRDWLKQNVLIEERSLPPGVGAWLKDVKSFGIETRMRHE